MADEHFVEFVKCYGPDPNGHGKRKESDSPAGGKKGYLGGDRWHKFTIAEVRERNYKLDGFKWLKDEDLEGSDELPEPEELATDPIAELEAAVDELNVVLRLLEPSNRTGSS